MRKSIIIFLLISFIVALSACSDKKIHDNTVTVTFFTANTQTSRVPQITGLSSGDLVTKPEDPTRHGFDFVGWYKDVEKTIPWNFDTDVVGEKSIVLYAKWVPGVYDIIYVVNGGEMPEEYPKSYEPNTIVILPSPKMRGYSFSGWYLYEWVDETSTKPGDFGYRFLPRDWAKDVTLHAHWKAIKVAVTFDVNYPGTDTPPAKPNSRTVAFGETIDFPILENTTQYKFVGWNSLRDGTGNWYVNGEVFERTQRTTAYAIWQAL